MTCPPFSTDVISSPPALSIIPAVLAAWPNVENYAKGRARVAQGGELVKSGQMLPPGQSSSWGNPKYIENGHLVPDSVE